MKKIIDFFKRLFKKSELQKEECIETKSIIDEEIKVEAKKEETKKVCPNCSGSLANGRTSANNEFGEYYICCSSCGFVSKVVNGEIITPPNTVREAIKAQILFKDNGLKLSTYSMEKGGEKKTLEQLKEAYRYNREG